MNEKKILKKRKTSSLLEESAKSAPGTSFCGWIKLSRKDFFQDILQHLLRKYKLVVFGRRDIHSLRRVLTTKNC